MGLTCTCDVSEHLLAMGVEGRECEALSPVLPEELALAKQLVIDLVSRVFTVVTHPRLSRTLTFATTHTGSGGQLQEYTCTDDSNYMLLNKYTKRCVSYIY